MSEGAEAAEWMAFLSPFSEASLNRFVTGQLGLGTGQDRAESGMEIPSKRPASLLCLKIPRAFGNRGLPGGRCGCI